MTQREICKYLYDINECCKRLVDFTDGKTLEDYQATALLRSGVERQFEIIGEAMGQLLKKAPDFEGKITDCRRIVAFRNLLIHGYADVDDELVWGIVENQLPKLCDEVQVLLDEYS